MRFKFENYIVIKKVAIAKFAQLPTRILQQYNFRRFQEFLGAITIIMFMFLNFILLDIIAVIIIIITVAMYRSQPACILSIIIVKHQYPETALISLATDRIYAYIIRKISFNRNITLTYILRSYIDRFLICIK